MDTASLKEQWANGVAGGQVNDFLCPQGKGKEDWVAQCMFDSGSWTIQVHPKDMKVFLKANSDWMALDGTAAFRRFSDQASLDDVCSDLANVFASLEADYGPLAFISES